MTQRGAHRVVVIGAGFAGLSAVRALAGANVAITVIDRRNFHLFQPLLYQVAAAALNPSDIAFPIRSVLRTQANVERVVLGTVVDIDADGRQVELDDGSRLSYDTLIVSPGAAHSYFGNDQWAATAPGLKTVEDALEIRRRILLAFETAERRPHDVAELLTFVVVGAGPTGVELAGALVEIAVDAMKGEFDLIEPSAARIVLVEGSEAVLPPYPESLRRSARRQLEEMGVEVRTGALVTAVDARGVTLSTGERIPSATVLWAAGVQASPLVAMLPGETDRAGRMIVAPDLTVPGHPEILVLGDAALVAGGAVPGVAPAAMQQGRHAARLIHDRLRGRPPSPFRYRNKGSLATIGRARAVAHFPLVRFSGFPAWVAWMAIHIWFLIGVRNRFFVFASWAWSYLTFKRGARIITGLPGASRTAPDASLDSRGRPDEESE
ncbi:MAG TPA: NAD(P)/FAD-dependent oxidoreductase [Acidimicrobiia bacterium]|nr:NAD(P)/FAD-dependent oxidoreductase [Acidimicrobiia bacterium]